MKVRASIGALALAAATIATNAPTVPAASAQSASPSANPGFQAAPPTTGPGVGPRSFSPLAAPLAPDPTVELEAIAPEVAGPEGSTAGTLDPSFSDDGIATPNFVPGVEDAAAVVVQEDGRIVVGGGAGNSNSKFQVARFNADGSRDLTFGGGDGVVRTDLSRGPDWIEDLALEPDGKIVAVGTAWGVSAIARYTVSGALDSSYSHDGIQFLQVGRGFNIATAVGIASGGAVVLGGRAGGHGGQFVVARTTVNGNPDLSFGGDGIALTDFGPGDDFVRDLAIRDDDYVVAVGQGEGPYDPADMLVAQYKATGVPDTTFHSNGQRTLGYNDGPEIATSVVFDGVDPVIGGYTNLNGGEMIIYRISSSGLLDLDFGDYGVALVDYTSAADYVWRLALQGDGSIVVAGRAAGQGGRFALARLTEAGALDLSFSGDGKLTTDFGPNDDEAHSVAVDVNGNIVASGFAHGGTDSSRIAIARYLGS